MKDVDQVVKLIKDEDLWVSDDQVFQKAIKETKSLIKEDMTERELYLAFKPIEACSEVGILYSEETSKKHKEGVLYMPIRIKTKDGKKIVIDDITGLIPSDSEIISINEWKIEDILEILYLKKDLLIEEYNSIKKNDGLNEKMDEEDYYEGMDRTFGQSVINILGDTVYTIVVKKDSSFEKYELDAVDLKTMADYIHEKDEEEKISKMSEQELIKYKIMLEKAEEMKKEWEEMKEKGEIPTYSVKDNSTYVKLKYSGLRANYGELVHHEPAEVN